MRWGESETRLFVKLYLDHKCLWNSEHDDYKIKHKRQAAYREIVSKFHAITNILLHEREVVLKIRSLKSTYSQEIAKIRARSSPGAPYMTKLGWFKDWDKCFRISRRKQLGMTSSCDEAPEVDTETEDSSQRIWFSEEIDNCENNSETEKDPFISPTDDDYVLLLKSEPVDEEHTESPYKRKKYKRNSTSSECSKDIVESKYEGKEDEFDIYGKYIASQLRNMDIATALKAQLQIQSIVSEARIESLTEKK
ncbi:uncharacterized protein LOC126373871 [Pectinophora gossypiella]|uniref:MADF domain-containing protein n=1 Tax=Pectinophora gossypiella TaxID=13191 RepID=A0A1E1WPF2_PECGO|nr:uncharacterized protein LOC126373871 [Pectinophora gossypiella]